VQLIHIADPIEQASRYEFAKWLDVALLNHAILTRCCLSWHPLEPKLPSDISLDTDKKGNCGSYITESATVAEQHFSISLYNNLSAAIWTSTFAPTKRELTSLTYFYHIRLFANVVLNSIASIIDCLTNKECLFNRRSVDLEKFK
jgi:hypothetical protein